MGALQKKAHINLTAITIVRTMERNKRNSIAGFPMRPERINEDRDGAGGFGLSEMGMNAPSQVSHMMCFPRAWQTLVLLPCRGKINNSILKIHLHGVTLDK